MNAPATTAFPDLSRREGGSGGPDAPPERMRGYLEVGLASLANGAIGTMVAYTDMPVTMLLFLRMLFAAIALGIVVFITGSWRDLRTSGAPIRVLGICVSLTVNLILYFLAIRYTGVSIAIFLSYLAPVYIAFVAPRLLKEPTERVVYVALAIGLVGMALILVPGLVLEGAKLSALGLFYGWLAGIGYAAYLLIAKTLRTLNVRSTAVVFSQSTFTAAAVFIPGLLAVSSSHYAFTGTDLVMALLLGLVTTAFTFTLFMDGMQYIRVQHSSIMGYLEPVSAPIYALVFLGQVPSVWTIAGGALIVAAGMLVVLYARGEPEIEPLG